MSNSELSDTFTTLLNSYNTQAQFGEQASKREIVLDEYEKSVLLTQAQDIIVKSYFDGRLNSQGQGFDDSTRRQVDFSSLIKVVELAPIFNKKSILYVGDQELDIVNKTNKSLRLVIMGATNGTIAYGNVAFPNTQGAVDAVYNSSGNALYIGLRVEDQAWDINIGDWKDLVTAILGCSIGGDKRVSSLIDMDYKDPDIELPDPVDPDTKALEIVSDTTLAGTTFISFDERGIMYQMPEPNDGRSMTDVLFILNEKLIYKPTSDSKNKKEYVIVPINYKEYDREMSKPYAQPLKKQAWRLFQNISTGFDVNSELIPKWNIANKNPTDFIYKLRYVRRPVPIILEDLPDGLVIDGLSTESQCELNPILHMDILNKAVELAITTRGGGTTTGSSDTQRQ